MTEKTLTWRIPASCALRLLDTKPYLISFMISLGITCVLIFFNPLPETASSTADEVMELVNLETVQSQGRVTVREISTDESAPVAEDPTKATGNSDENNPVDLSFMPDVLPPRPLGKLLRLYPALARDMNIEAVVNVEVTLSSEGIVKGVRVLGARLSGNIPDNIKKNLITAFSGDAVKILMAARFSNPVVNGKNLPVKMEMPLKFRLN